MLPLYYSAVGSLEADPSLFTSRGVCADCYKLISEELDAMFEQVTEDKATYEAKLGSLLAVNSSASESESEIGGGEVSINPEALKREIAAIDAETNAVDTELTKLEGIDASLTGREIA